MSKWAKVSGCFIPVVKIYISVVSISDKKNRQYFSFTFNRKKEGLGSKPTHEVRQFF